MTTTYVFHVQQLSRLSREGENLFTVILTKDGKVKGGDHHWVTRQAAERAIRLYQVDPEAHGLTESALRRRYFDHFRKAMFAS